MTNTCIPTTKPTTDETPIECNGLYTSWKCTQADEAIAFLNTPPGASLELILTNLIQEVSDLKTKVDTQHPI